MHDTMAMTQAGYLDYGFLGAAQIDAYGNVNTTVIGTHDRPTVRLPGSGGGNDVGSLCWRTIVIMRQEARRFVETLDFLTTPGYLSGPDAREAAGLPAGSGPYRVITQLGVYGFDDATKRMRLLTIHPGVTLDQIREQSAFKISVPAGLSVSEPPTHNELRILRAIDPAQIVLR